jgi:hypothetical protein
VRRRSEEARSEKREERRLLPTSRLASRQLPIFPKSQNPRRVGTGWSSWPDNVCATDRIDEAKIAPSWSMSTTISLFIEQ